MDPPTSTQQPIPTYPLIIEQPIEINKCATCGHSLFIRIHKADSKWYCDIHHPDKINHMLQRREREDILLGFDSNEKVRNLEAIILAKDQEIEMLKELLKQHGVDEELNVGFIKNPNLIFEFKGGFYDENEIKLFF